MGFEVNEIPTIDATLYYYDKGNCTSPEFCEKILHAFKKYDFYDITNVVLVKHRLINGLWEDYDVRYNKNQLLMINLREELYKWINDDEIMSIALIHKEKRNWMWDLTWCKNYTSKDGELLSDCFFNFISLTSVYDCLDTKDNQAKFVGLFCELSDLFYAFYGSIEDASSSVDLWDKTKEKCFDHNHLQTVFWGNYFGQKYCQDIGLDKLKQSPFEVKKQTKNGIFLAVTDDLHDSLINCNFRQRKKLFKYLTQKH